MIYEGNALEQFSFINYQHCLDYFESVPFPSVVKVFNLFLLYLPFFLFLHYQEKLFSYKLGDKGMIIH